MHKKQVNPTYELGQIVYLKTDEQQLPRMVTCWLIRTDSYRYELSQGVSVSHHMEEEITVSKNIRYELGLD